MIPHPYKEIKMEADCDIIRGKIACQKNVIFFGTFENPLIADFSKVDT